jgi:hypothetical protein
MDAPLKQGWYLIVRKDAQDQTAQVRAEWDGTHFRLGEENVDPEDVAVWKPILEEWATSGSR